MNVALVDNMNNNFFALARYLRDLRVEADLYLIPGRGHKHFDPQEDTWVDLSNLNWIKEFPLSYNSSSYLMPVRKRLISTFSKYDKIIACGASVGLFNKAGIDVDLFIPYGGDLFQMPFPGYKDFVWPKSFLRNILTENKSKFQRTGIQRAKKIIVNTNWFVASEALVKIKCKAINLPRIMIYKEPYPVSLDTEYAWLSDYDFSIFSPTRHLWATNADPLPDFDQNGGMKRNDKLIRAFSRLVDSRLVQRPLLLLCEYGADVCHSKKLITDLKMDGYVKWLPLLPRKEVSVIMRHVSVIADQFRETMSATSAGTTNEALAIGKPIITNADGANADINDPYFSCPILQAVTESDIYEWLKKLSLSPHFAKKIGDAGAKWFDENLSFGLAEKYINLL